MPDTTKRQRRSSTTAAELQPQQPTQTHARVEMRWLNDAREVEDLSNLATKIKGNPGRRGEAGAYVIHLWSRVIHGELSPSAFWEIFGVTPPAPTPAPPMYPGMYPGMVMPGMVPSPPQGYEVVEPAEDPETTAKKRKRAENRKAQADQWTN